MCLNFKEQVKTAENITICGKHKLTVNFTSYVTTLTVKINNYQQLHTSIISYPLKFGCVQRFI